MLKIDLPGREITLDHVVLDFNGTLALDGSLLPGARKRLEDLARKAALYVFTADTIGSAAGECAGLPVEMVRVSPQEGGVDKARLVERLGADRTAAIGNGRNDALMLQKAALGLVVLGEEGADVGALLAADVVFPHILAALDFLLKPRRAVATLRP
ncbi:MAG: ATPase P [Thermoanaerobacteraceae bacterium]|nr:ATPase P [Thermoanaerobacteraceae bacterium]